MVAIARRIDLRRLYWVGPATIAASVMAVVIAQRSLIAMLPLFPRFAKSVLNSNEPGTVTAVLVTAAVVTFGIVANAAESPLPTFRRLAFGALLLSFVPNVVVALAVPTADWPSMLALMILHVIAWGVTTTMLTRLTTVDHRI